MFQFRRRWQPVFKPVPVLRQKGSRILILPVVFPLPGKQRRPIRRLPSRVNPIRFRQALGIFFTQLCQFRLQLVLLPGQLVKLPVGGGHRCRLRGHRNLPPRLRKRLSIGLLFRFQPDNLRPAILQFRPLRLRPGQLLLQPGNLRRCFCHGAAIAPEGNQCAASGPEGVHGLFKITHIVGVLHQIAQLRPDAVGGQASAVVALGQIGAALKGIPVQPEQLHADLGGKAAALPPRIQIDQVKGIAPGRGAESSLYAVAFRSQLEGQAAAAFAAVPRQIFLAFALVQRFGFPGEAVKHGTDEFGQRGLAKPVRLLQNSQLPGKVQRVPAQTAKILDIQTDQLHSATSSPLSAWMPQRIICSLSSALLSEASTMRMNSPFREMSCS